MGAALLKGLLASSFAGWRADQRLGLGATPLSFRLRRTETPGAQRDLPLRPRRPSLVGQGVGRTDTPFAYESTSTIVVGLASVAEPPAPSMTDCRPPDWPGVGQVPLTEQV